MPSFVLAVLLKNPTPVSVEARSEELIFKTPTLFCQLSLKLFNVMSLLVLLLVFAVSEEVGTVIVSA